MSFFNFFSSPAQTDGLTQTEREAIADILYYCMYADNHLALAEAKVLDDAVSQMSWDASVSFQYFEAKSIARAREAKENADARAAFFKSLQERLSSNASRARALNLATKLFLSDGATSDKESALLSEIKQLLA